ncbi:Scr1 family TA system antitoxin-like transcriptional regulator [Saccharothrix sp. Mg75]|uniref:Scr1 family TA system antitoxin-like transcriptional regulator n=1 Tax=Saccharothrix sp. Mg75 TaxID=3445357 RepID=UPI003EEED6FC
MTAGEDARPSLRLVAGLGWARGGPSTVDRARCGPDLIDLVGLVGARPAPVPESAPWVTGVEHVVFETLCVPAALRTPAYATALGEDRTDPVPSGPVRYFLHEAALHAEVGGAEVMADQCDALADAEGVLVRLVPFAAGHGALLRSSFTQPRGGPQGALVNRIALDAAASKRAFRTRASFYRDRSTIPM